MKKLRVLQFPIGNNKGGITQYALKNWEYIDKTKFVFDFATMHSELDFERELINSGSKVYHIKKYAEDDTDIFSNQFKEILKNKYDIVHLHTSFWKSFEVEKIAIEMNVPKIIIHSHSTSTDVLDNEDRVQALIRHNELKEEISDEYATDFWACSKLAAEWLYGQNVPKDEIVIMKNAIEVSKFSYNEVVRNNIREELGLKGFIIGHIGRFTYQKNHEFIIDIFYELLKTLPIASLILIGVGPQKEYIVDKATRLGVIDNIIFLEKVDNVNELIQAMDVFILPSHFEGFPIVLVEAQASGIKCLASTLITEEIKLVDNLVQLPLELNLWVSHLIEISKGYKRCNLEMDITKSGYSIEENIKNLEQKYLQGFK